MKGQETESILRERRSQSAVIDLRRGTSVCGKVGVFARKKLTPKVIGFIDLCARFSLGRIKGCGLFRRVEVIVREACSLTPVGG